MLVIYVIGDSMRFYIAFFSSLIAGISTIIGGLIIFLNFKNKENIITAGLSVAAGVMISLSVFELIPSSISNILNKNSLFIGIIIIIGMFEIGCLIIYLSSILAGKSSDTLYRLGFLNMIAIMLHNFPEGIASFITTFNNFEVGYKISLAILIHNIPEGLSIAIPIYYSTKSRGRAILYCAISGLSEPLGALLCYFLIKNNISIINMDILFLIIAGLMISLSIFKIFPEIKKYNNNKLKVLGLFIGCLIIFITIFII